MQFVCRGCMTQITKGQNHFSLKVDSVKHLYEQCTGIEVIATTEKVSRNYVPLELCTVCYEACVTFNNFRAQCKLSDDTFKLWTFTDGPSSAFCVSSIWRKPLDLMQVDTDDEEQLYDVYEVEDVIKQLEFDSPPVVDINVSHIPPYERSNVSLCEFDSESDSFENEYLMDSEDDSPVLKTKSNLKPTNDVSKRDPKNDAEKKGNTNGLKNKVNLEDRFFEDDFVWPFPDEEKICSYIYNLPCTNGLVMAKEKPPTPEEETCAECNLTMKYRERKQHYDRWRQDIVPEGNTIDYQSCEKCKFTSYNKCALTEHMRLHINPPKHLQLCYICGELRGKLSDHLENKHSNIPPKLCTLCDTMIPHQSYEYHMKNTHKVGIVTFECLICHKMINSEKRLMHLDSHDQEKKHKCDICGKAFRKHADLADHIDIHTGLKRFFCRFCGENMTRMQRRFHQKVCASNPNRESPAPAKKGRRKKMVVQIPSTVASNSEEQIDEMDSVENTMDNSMEYTADTVEFGEEELVEETIYDFEFESENYEILNDIMD